MSTTEQRKTAAETVTSMADEVRGATTMARVKASEIADAAVEKGSEIAETGKDHMVAAQQSFDAAVRRNPTTAVLGAVGLGVLIGMAMRSRS